MGESEIQTVCDHASVLSYGWKCS